MGQTFLIKVYNFPQPARLGLKELVRGLQGGGGWPPAPPLRVPAEGGTHKKDTLNLTFALN